MKPKGLLVAVALLAVLGGAVWWSNRKQAAAAKAGTDSGNKILSIPDEQFQEIRMKKLTGEVLNLRRDSGKWQITAPEALPADQDSVSSMVLNLSSLNADKVIDENAADLKPYGLNDPTLDIQVVRKDGKTDELLIGDDTPTGSGAYAKLASAPKVYTIGSYVKSTLDKRPDDLRDKRLLSFDSDKLTRVELQAKGGVVEFGKNASNEWQIVKPRPLRADSTAVDSLVNKLKDAKMDVTVLSSDAAKKYAAAPKVATATVTDSSGNQTIEVHKEKAGDWFAKSSAVNGIYKVAADVGEGLEKSLADFRNKKIFDFGFSDPSQLVVKGVTYNKSGDKWMTGSRTLENISVQNLIDKLRELRAQSFPEKGGGEHVIDLSVTSNSGKRVEKVAVTKSGDKYFAQREAEPTIYELSTTDVGDIQRLAGEIKDAAPDTKKK